MKVRMYNSSKFHNTTVLDDVERITAMPEPIDITPEDIEYSDGIMLTLYRTNGADTIIPHSFLIEILP